MATKPTRFAQMGDTTEKVKAYVGIPKQLVVDTSKWRMRLLDGATPGGIEFAMVRDLQDYATPEVCTQLIYEINEVRRKSTAYQVGDKVDCAFQYERFLECTKAGTTSADLLDTRSVTHGQVIADGTVEWTVRTHVRSVNGNVASADGNVLVDVGAKTVEGKAPDGNGNVALGLHAVATSGSYNDLSNKPNIPPATRMMPNYGSFVQITKGDFTPTYDGWLRLENMNNGDYTGGKVIHKASGAKLFEFYQNRYPGTATGILPVLAGETYTVSNAGNVYFHPMR